MGNIMHLGISYYRTVYVLMYFLGFAINMWSSFASVYFSYCEQRLNKVFIWYTVEKTLVPDLLKAFLLLCISQPDLEQAIIWNPVSKCLEKNRIVSFLANNSKHGLCFDHQLLGANLIGTNCWVPTSLACCTPKKKNWHHAPCTSHLCQRDPELIRHVGPHLLDRRGWTLAIWQFKHQQLPLRENAFYRMCQETNTAHSLSPGCEDKP